MTSIGGQQQAGLQAILQLSQRLAAGQPVQARVLGQTQHGVSVSIGREAYHLNVPSRLANAETLTLQGTTSPSPSGQKVSIVAWDNRPLLKPIEAHLIAGTRTSQPSASTIVQRSEIKVVANPVSPEGKVLGPGVTLHLQTSPLEAVVKATGEKSPTVSGNRPAVEPNFSHRVPVDSVRSGGALVPPASNVPHDHGTAGSAEKPELTGKIPQRILPEPTPPVMSPTLVSPPPATVKSASDGAQLLGDHSRQLQRAASSAPSSESEPVPIKGATPQPAVSNKQGVVTEARSLTQTPHTVEQQTAAGRSVTVTASVVGRTSAGNVVLEAAGQLLRIEQPVDLPPGTTLQVMFASGMSAGMAPADRRTAESPATLLNKLVGLLDDIDRAGQQTADPGHSPPTKQLPMADRHLASRFLGLLPPEAGGQAAAKAMSSQEPGGTVAPKGDQIQTLVRELGSMASESLADGWKSMTLPLGSDQSQAVSLYFRGHDLDPDEETSDEDAEHKPAQRAVFDVSFSQLGRCQIDAFCQEQRFDLLIRSEKPFDPKDRQDVATLFVSACEIAGLKGEIGFNVGSFFEPVRSPSIATELRT